MMNIFTLYIHSFPYFTPFFLLLPLLSSFLISNSVPTVVNSTCNKWKLKSPALCSTGLFTSKKPLPSPYSVLFFSFTFPPTSSTSLSLSFKTGPFLFHLLFIQIHHTFFLPIFSCTCLNSLLNAYISLLRFYDAAGIIFFS